MQPPDQDDPLESARAGLADTLDNLASSAIKADSAMLPAARNAIVALGGLVRFGAPPREMADAVVRTGELILPHLERDPGEALMFPLLQAQARALAEVIAQHGDLGDMDDEDRATWEEGAYEVLSSRDLADAWLLGAAALLRWLDPGAQRGNLERVRERAVHAVASFDRALSPALTGLSTLKDAAKRAIVRARTDKGYMRRAFYWVKIIETSGTN